MFLFKEKGSFLGAPIIFKRRVQRAPILLFRAFLKENGWGEIRGWPFHQLVGHCFLHTSLRKMNGYVGITVAWAVLKVPIPFSRAF